MSGNNDRVKMHERWAIIIRQDRKSPVSGTGTGVAQLKTVCALSFLMHHDRIVQPSRKRVCWMKLRSVCYNFVVLCLVFFSKEANVGIAYIGVQKHCLIELCWLLHSFTAREEAWGLCKSEALQPRLRAEDLAVCSPAGSRWHRAALPPGARRGGSVCAEQQLSWGRPDRSCMLLVTGALSAALKNWVGLNPLFSCTSVGLLNRIQWLCTANTFFLSVWYSLSKLPRLSYYFPFVHLIQVLTICLPPEDEA